MHLLVPSRLCKLAGLDLCGNCREKKQLPMYLLPPSSKDVHANILVMNMPKIGGPWFCHEQQDGKNIYSPYKCIYVYIIVVSL